MTTQQLPQVVSPAASNCAVSGPGRREERSTCTERSPPPGGCEQAPVYRKNLSLRWLRQRYRSPPKSRRHRREPSRSASTKPTRPRRGKEPSVEKETKEVKEVTMGKSETPKREVKKNPNTPKKMTFRDFMMNHCEDGTSPEDAILAFKAFCEDVTKKEVETLKGTGLFFDLYHPMARLRLHDWQHKMAQLRSQSFMEDLNADKYLGLSLRARRPQMSGGATSAMAPTCPVAGHLKAPEYAFDANVGALMISGLPAAASTWDARCLRLDEWTLRDCCGPTAVREESSTADKASMWTDGHEKRIQTFLELSLDKEAASEKILKVHDQKFQCQVCNKFFKGQEYVFKHLHRFHLNILDDIREEFFQEMSQTAFLADPDHPPAHALSC
eukprot:Skav226717  [mRNA]  locus=scaffold3811:201936:205151:- [translate_table: standard]